MKIDFYKIVIILLLVAIVFSLYILSIKIEESGKNNRFITIDENTLLDTRSGAVYRLHSGQADKITPEIVK